MNKGTKWNKNGTELHRQLNILSDFFFFAAPAPQPRHPRRNKFRLPISSTAIHSVSSPRPHTPNACPLSTPCFLSTHPVVIFLSSILNTILRLNIYFFIFFFRSAQIFIHLSLALRFNIFDIFNILNRKIETYFFRGKDLCLQFSSCKMKNEDQRGT